MGEENNTTIVPEEETERDFITLVDDDGNEIELDVVDYFFYNGDEYAVLMDLSDMECGCGCEDDHAHDESCDGCGVECGIEKDAIIMRVITNGDTEEFVPVEDELFEELSAVALSHFEMDDEEEEEEEAGKEKE